MSFDSELPSYVSDVGRRIVVRNVSPTLRRTLVREGALWDEEHERLVWETDSSDKRDWAEKLGRLRDLGVAFSYGRDWNPADLFENLREHCWITGPYTRVVWRGEKEYTMTAR